jgi:pyruvate dehydrogenase E1 component alpha subunit
VVHQCAARAIARARAGDGPTLIEARNYRLHGHVEAEASFLSSAYRSDEEIEEWRKRDPIALFSKRLRDADIADDAALSAIDAEVQKEVEAAVAFAEGSDWPTPEQATRHMFT